MEILLEKYVGRSSTTDTLEKEIKQLRKVIKSENVLKGGSFKRINESDNVAKIGILLAKLFEVRKVMFVVDFKEHKNAYTRPKSYIMFNKNIKKNSKGQYSGGKAIDIVVVMTYGILTDDDITEGEIVALTLHEMGHNFYKSPYQLAVNMSLMTPVVDLTLLGLTDLLNSGYKIQNFSNFIYKLIDKIPAYSKLSMTLNKTMRSVFDLLPTSVMTPAVLKSINVNTINRILFNYNVEKHADSVAVNYGYGKELSTALTKIIANDGLRGKLENTNNPIGMVYQVDTIVMELVSSVITGYPTEQNRVKSNLDRLEKSLNDNSLPKEVKVELRQQHKDLTKFYEEFYLKANDEDRRKIIKGMRNYVQVTFDGKMDLREVLAKTDKELE